MAVTLLCAMRAVTLTVVIFILWPLLALPARVFSQGYFTMWIVIALIWGSTAGPTCDIRQRGALQPCPSALCPVRHTVALCRSSRR